MFDHAVGHEVAVLGAQDPGGELDVVGLQEVLGPRQAVPGDGVGRDEQRDERRAAQR